MFNEKFIQTDAQTQIAYIDEGEGQPIIFIPGWCMFKEIFHHQISYFSQKYRVIALDPRGQGHSSKSVINSCYAAHAADLLSIIEQLKLNNCIVAAWSYGCLTSYSYIRQFGTKNIAAFIFIDLGPVPRAHAQYQWGWDSDAMCKAFQPMIYDYPKLLKDMWLFHSSTLSEADLQWIIENTLQTPVYIAALLNAEGLSANYEAEAISIDNKIPVLYIVQKHFKDPAFAWLKINAPHAKKAALGSHLMFFELPDKFNQLVEKFLQQEISLCH